MLSIGIKAANGKVLAKWEELLQRVKSQSVWWTECTWSRANYQTHRHESIEAWELIKKSLWRNLEGWPVPPNSLAFVPAAQLVKRALSVMWAYTWSCTTERRRMCNTIANGCLELPSPFQNNPAFQSLSNLGEMPKRETWKAQFLNSSLRNKLGVWLDALCVTGTSSVWHLEALLLGFYFLNTLSCTFVAWERGDNRKTSQAHLTAVLP